jgi:hypothetical protein
MLQKIRELYARLAELTAEEVAQLRADIIKCRKEYDDTSKAENVDILGELADMGEAAKGRLAAIKAEETAREEAATAAKARLDALDEPEDPEGDEPESDEEKAAKAAAKATATETATDGPDATTDVLPVAASAHRASPSSMRRSVTKSLELSDPNDRRIRVLAASALPTKQYGEEFTSKTDLAEVMATKLSRMDRREGSNRVTVASAEWGHLYGPERHLLFDGEGDAAKLDAGFAIASRRTSLAPLAASGGVPLPTNVDYAEDTWAVADRPVRAGLDPYAVDRGGLLYRQPPDLAALASATTIWTNANDIDPTDPTTKPVLQITSPDTTQVYISAVPTRLGFGNLMGQFDPETIAANTDLAIAAAARIAETNLINSIFAFATGVTTSQVMGAARDLFQAIVKVAAAYRFSFRLARDLPLNILLPSWTLDLFKADRIWELAHDSAGSFDPFMIDDAYIERALANYSIYPIWSLDGAAANSTVTPNFVTQNFTAFPAAGSGGAAPAFPTEVAWLLFIKGSVQFLDGGRLDLGVVRDSTLDATNDYETFVETFENVANRGFPGGVIYTVSSLLPTGASSEGIAA